MGKMTKWAACLVAGLIGLGWGASARAVEEIGVGILAYRGAERAEAEWEPTLRHLNQTISEYRFRAVPLDLDGVRQAVAEGQVGFVITNPGHYVELEAAFHIARIATVETVDGPSPATAVGSAVVVRAGSPVRTMADLSGMRLAAVAPEAFGGFRLAWRELLSRGIDPFRDLETVSFTGFPIERVLTAVAEGRADAGVVRACLLEQMVAEGHLQPGTFRVLGGRLPPGLKCEVSTALYPDWPFARTPAISTALAKTVGTALLSMPAADGQAWTVPADYQVVHELFQVLKIGPYAALAQRSPVEWARDNWGWLAAVVVAVLWWIAHVARVEYLVRVRTEALQAAGEQARRQRDELDHAARLALLGEMASSLAHELNQPLAAIHAYASGCERRLASGTDPAGVREGVRLIAGQAERAAGIVRRIRAFVRKRAAEQVAVSINEPVLAALDLFGASAHRRAVRVESRLGEGLPVVLADRIQIEQVVLNLLQNAADSMEGTAADHSPREVLVTTARTPVGIEVSVADRGSGLTDEVRERLFEPFFTTKPDGLGLGLSLSRSILEAHGGHLWAEDRPGGGTRFAFTVPIPESTLGTPPLHSEPPAGTAVPEEP